MNLFEARAKKRMTQWELALKTGVSQSKLSLIERGFILPSIKEKEKIIAAIGVNKNEIQWPEPRENLRA